MLSSRAKTSPIILLRKIQRKSISQKNASKAKPSPDSSDEFGTEALVEKKVKRNIIQQPGNLFDEEAIIFLKLFCR